MVVGAFKVEGVEGELNTWKREEERLNICKYILWFIGVIAVFYYLSNTQHPLRQSLCNEAVSICCERATNGDMTVSSHGAVALGQPLSAPVLQSQLVRQNIKATQSGEMEF